MESCISSMSCKSFTPLMAVSPTRRLADFVIREKYSKMSYNNADNNTFCTVMVFSCSKFPHTFVIFYFIYVHLIRNTRGFCN